MIWGILVGTIGVGVVGAVGVYFAMRRRQAPQEGEFLFRHNCPRCKQRIGYRKRQMGRKAMCPNCFQPFTYPGETAIQKPPAESP